MSEQTGRKGTYYTLAKWYRWACIIIILVPLAVLIMAGINLAMGGSQEWYLTGVNVLSIISLVAAIIFVVLTIIMFFAAGTVRGQASPLGIRIGLLIALCLVFATGIFILVVSYIPSLQDEEWVNWVVLFLPVITMAGYITGAILGSKIKNALA